MFTLPLAAGGHQLEALGPLPGLGTQLLPPRILGLPRGWVLPEQARLHHNCCAAGGDDGVVVVSAGLDVDSVVLVGLPWDF